MITGLLGSGPQAGIILRRLLRREGARTSLTHCGAWACKTPSAQRRLKGQVMTSARGIPASFSGSSRALIMAFSNRPESGGCRSMAWPRIIGIESSTDLKF